ncbi:hypothetical protein GCK72_012660 [Caenorhabditis remanei]|uniref:Uncharacterized protein n=1 Tax=Caenorhabditis remanei TaxID=31234 RepID=A0A6A5GLQ7_CAERE|nr:hypothetical protein GCK72_012660 [Caenorhabditis remanei]KAF1756207.1 hypothetical protein GCK72_012660 [Caenorhabditis remanei]
MHEILLETHILSAFCICAPGIMGKEKLAFAKELTETLRMFREQMVASAEIQQQQMAENRRLHEEIAARAAAGSETETLENVTVQTP